MTVPNYSRRAATFSASIDVRHSRSITGQNGPSASALFHASFPQPDDVDEDDIDEDAPDENANLASEELHSEAAMTGGGPTKSARLPSKGKLDDKHAVPTNMPHRNSTAPSVPPMVSGARNIPQKRPVSGSNTMSLPDPSYVTALESAEIIQYPTATDSGKGTRGGLEEDLGPRSSPDLAMISQHDGAHPSSMPSNATQRTSTTAESALAGNAANSTTSLIPHQVDGSAPTVLDRGAQDSPNIHPIPGPSGLVRFDVPGNSATSQGLSRPNLLQASRRRSWRQIRRGKSHPGEILKIEKMLVRVDSTLQELPSDYNENDSLKTESRTVDKWREFIVVCRESAEDNADFSIQMYKTRVIPAIEKSHFPTRASHEISLVRKNTNVNFYSSLDKTLVIWVPWKAGTRIYILRTRSYASAVEWYTFIRSSLGWRRPSNLEIYVPDLSVTLSIQDPFGEFEATRDAALAGEANDAAIIKTMEAEKAMAGNIIDRCMEMLTDIPEWAHVLETWLQHEKMGLAWKRYDRLEWVHGANEQRMYGTIAMQKSHDLELRPKQHYPTNVLLQDGSHMEEPPPLEGFLVRLTSQKGHVRRFGKMFFKRLYFSTNDQYLCYCRPALASPPPPPTFNLTKDFKIPSAQQIINHTPVIFSVNPYPVSQGGIEWLRHGTSQTKQKHDFEAYKEAERKDQTMLKAEGYINLSHVIRVQNVQRGISPADQNVGEGPEVDFHQSVPDSNLDDGKTNRFDDHKTFEMVLKNGLVIRLQAYDEATKKEWMDGLDKLIRYWKARLASDMNVYKAIRRLNLKRLEIDEEMEAMLGQFAEKWEVTRAEASPQLFNMCGISCCRTITVSGPAPQNMMNLELICPQMSGVLYRKPKRHSTFLRCGVILCHGQLLIFHGALRDRIGKELLHIQHDRQAAINLSECYVYSGLITESDLLYRNQTFDSNHPGHHALPKVYREDGWTSTDEDTMTCFVLWCGRRKSLFRTDRDEEGRPRQRLRYVSRLGVPGRSIVFKTRSRAERDHWVLNLGLEIDRLQGGEDIRVAT